MTETPNTVPQRGGSYLNDDATGTLVPIFVPESGMDPDATAGNAPPAPQPDPETPAEEAPVTDDAAEEEIP